MRMLSHLDCIFSSADLVLALIWFLNPNQLEIEIFSEPPPVFHVYQSDHVTPNWLVHCDRLSTSDC